MCDSFQLLGSAELLHGIWEREERTTTGVWSEQLKELPQESLKSNQSSEAWKKESGLMLNSSLELQSFVKGRILENHLIKFLPFAEKQSEV